MARKQDSAISTREALLASEAQLTKQLEDARVLQKISIELVSEGGSGGDYNHIVAAARTLMRSDAASIQELDGDSRLKLLAHTGFHPESAAFWAFVDADVGSVCGRALTAQKRVVMPDIDKFQTDPDNMAAFSRSGIMSVQSTPLVASSGRIVGMMSTHWNHPHTPSAESYRFFDILARLAADFIERSRSETELRESEAKIRTMFEAMTEACCVFDLIYDERGKAVDWKILEANAGYERESGLKDVAGKLASEIMPGTEAYWIETFDRVARTGVSEKIEKWHQPTGRWIHSSTARVGGAGSRRLVSVFYDITQRKRREEQQEFRLRLMDSLRPLSDPFAIQSAALQTLGEFLGADRVFYTEMLSDGVTTRISDNYVREGVTKLVGNVDTTAFGDAADRLRKGETVVLADVNTDEFTEAEKTAYAGNDMVAAVAVSLVKSKAWVGTLVVHSRTPRQWTTHEVSVIEETAERMWAAVERARAEEAVRESHEKLEQRVNERTAELAEANHSLQVESDKRETAQEERVALLKQILTVQEDERRRIARDMHDHFGQQLTAMRLKLDAMERIGGSDERIKEKLLETQRVAQSLDSEVNFLVWELRPTALDDLGLTFALEHYVRKWSEQYAIPAVFHGHGFEDSTLSGEAATNLYRIAQEALNNISKHAHASNANVIIERRRKDVVLIVEDDGRGFTAAPNPDSGLGLKGMRERAELCGGSIEIESKLGGGTTIYVTVPISEEVGDKKNL